MKQPYKIQNRTSESRRVKFVKNGGTVSFPKTPTASFVENSREAGFCLTAITPLPLRDSATDKITLTSHPMGTDGRVSLYINGTLIESKRFLNKARIADRQAWFNSEFGAYVTYSGKELATFKTAIVSPDVYRFVFEDDDLDYIFADTTNAAGDLNPTLIVEQYRLAFDIVNNKVEISCDGATFESPYMTLTGDWQLEINGEKYTTRDTPIDTMLAMIAESDVEVVYETNTPAPESEEIITDFALTAWYNPELQRFEGVVRPTVKFVAVLGVDGAQIDVTSEVVTDGTGRWYYEREIAGVVGFDISTYLGNLEDDTLNPGETVYVEDFTLPTYRKADGSVIPTHQRHMPNVKNMHLYFKIGTGEIQKELCPIDNFDESLETIPVSDVLVNFAQSDTIGSFAEFLQRYTNIIEMSGAFGHKVNPDFVDVTLLSPKKGNIPLDEPLTLTLYRGMSTDSFDLFDTLFPGTVENFVTLTATASINPVDYVTPTSTLAVTRGEIIQHCRGLFVDTFRIIDTTNIDDLKMVEIPAKNWLSVSASDDESLVNFGNVQNIYMSYSNAGDQLAISVIGQIPDSVEEYSLIFGLNRIGTGIYERVGIAYTGELSYSYPIIEGQYLGWHNYSVYTQLKYQEGEARYDYVDDWFMGNFTYKMYNVKLHEHIALMSAYDQYTGSWGYGLAQVKFDPMFGGIQTGLADGLIPQSQYFDLGNKPFIVNISDTHSLILASNKMILVRLSDDLTVTKPTFSVIDDAEFITSIAEVSRTDTELYLVITNIHTEYYRFVAFNRTDFTIREISTGNVSALGGKYIYPIQDGVILSVETTDDVDLHFVTFDLQTGDTTSFVYPPK